MFSCRLRDTNVETKYISSPIAAIDLMSADASTVNI